MIINLDRKLANLLLNEVEDVLPFRKWRINPQRIGRMSFPGNYHEISPRLFVRSSALVVHMQFLVQLGLFLGGQAGNEGRGHLSYTFPKDTDFPRKFLIKRKRL